MKDTKDELIKKLDRNKDELIEWLETECQSPETADLSHSFAGSLMIRLADISYIESKISALEQEQKIPKKKKEDSKIKICAGCGSFAHGNPGHDISI